MNINIFTQFSLEIIKLFDSQGYHRQHINIVQLFNA